MPHFRLFLTASCWLIGALLTSSAKAQSIVGPKSGVWAGVVNLFGKEAPVFIDFSPLRQRAGSQRATLSLPTLGLHSMQVDKLMQGQGGDSLRLDVSSLPGSYIGRWSADSLTLTGWLLAAGQRLPLRLRAEDPARILPSRPQNPVAPVPYQEVAVSFGGGSLGVKLAGTLTLPKSHAAVPAVVLVSGSGPHNRDGEQFAHQPFRVLADALTRQGFAVLRYDERGVGASTGHFASALTADFTGDVAAALAALRANKRIDARRIYLLGHSQGSLEVLRVAAQDPVVAGLILLGGLAEPLAEVYKARLRSQMAPRLAASDTTGRADLMKTQRICEAIISIIAATPNDAAAAAALQQPIPAQGITVEELAYFAPTYLSPAIQDILRQAPLVSLRKIKMPVLAITGALDTEAPAGSQLPALTLALRNHGNSKVSAITIPRVTHFLQTIPADQELSPYDNPETLSVAIINSINQWLKQQTSSGGE